MNDGRLHNRYVYYRPVGQKSKRWRLVFVTSHDWMGGYNRISNFVSFSYVRKNGTLMEGRGDYDYGNDNFRHPVKAKFVQLEPRPLSLPAKGTKESLVPRKR